MHIPEIKQRLSILQVLEHYGLHPDRNKMIRCPFHEDKTPSMQVYPATGTVFCFSSNCKLNGKAVDQIDFIMFKENCDKRAAILKAKSLCGEEVFLSNEKKEPEAEITLDRIAVMVKVMTSAQHGLGKSKTAQAYCRQRGLDMDQIKPGFFGESYYNHWNAELVKSATAIGIMKPGRQGNPVAVIKNCLIFPMRNKQNKPVSIYGRSIKNLSAGKGHYYLKGKHLGLYPRYPSAETQKLILTESIIDAATLLQLPELTAKHEILALYGTNGMTDEHRAALQSLSNLKEIIFFFDGDPAGTKAADKYTKELSQLLPHTTISTAGLPEGEDVNSLHVAHEKEIFTHLLKERTVLFSAETKTSQEPKPKPETKPPKEPENAPELKTHVGGEKITWENETLCITVWGGVEYANLHRLKLSLHLADKENGNTFRDDVNLYSNRSKKAFLQDASEELETGQTRLKTQLETFTEKIETYRLKLREQYKADNTPRPPVLDPAEKKKAVEILRDPRLTEYIKSAAQKAGLIGEADNGLLLFLIFLTRNFENPLHALVHGSSGSGKTNLLKTMLKLIPEESKYETTALTENVLFRPPHRDFWKNKILLLEDLDGSYKALYPLREFMSNQHISKFSSEPNPKTGKFEQVLLEAHGPIVIAGATTKDKVYEDNSNRSFLLHINESKDHQKQILDFQNRRAAGLIDTGGIDRLCRGVHNIQRMLQKDIHVINPFQPRLKLPDYVFKKLRTNTHYITLIKSVTFLHQYRREQKKDSEGRTYITTELEDIALANQLSKHSLLRKSDELSGRLRQFFEDLKHHLSKTQNKKDKGTFLAKEVRAKLRMHPMKFSRYINELRNRGYVKKTAGKEKGSFEYRIEVWDDYQILQKGLTVMDAVLEKLYKEYPDGIYREKSK